MTYSLLNSVFLGLAFWFFVASMAVIGLQMRRRAGERSGRLGGPALAPGSAGIFGQGQSGDAQATETPPAASSARRPNLLLKYAVTLLVLLVFTAVFDNLIIGAGIVAYDPTKISGIFIGIAPIEDFAYTIAAVLVLPTLWGVLGHFGPLKGKPGGGSK